MFNTELREGTLLAGRYFIVRLLGSGGFGTVHEAVHMVTERRVAVKVPHPHIARQREFRERFLREGRLGARVAGEHVTQVLDAGLDEALDLPFLVMELLVGEGLDAKLKRAGRFGGNETVSVLLQVAKALEQAHACGVVHRDLKPNNLFVTRGGTVKVLDFGVARALDAATIGAGQLVGTPLYMAPEQFRQEELTPAVDMYALAMLAFKLLVGAHYHQGVTRLRAWEMGQVLSTGPVEPATVRAWRHGVWLPPRFDPWFAYAAHRDPSQRLVSPVRAIELLEVALEPTPTLAVVPPPPPPRRPQRSLAPALLAAILGACALLVGVVALASAGSERQLAHVPTPNPPPVPVVLRPAVAAQIAVPTASARRVRAAPTSSSRPESRMSLH
ncbi:MAG: serine/threonine protein kinase [Myxococcales bacterium]|nr:serine/threonine protein kinase [Myxococcales bacterium]